MSPLRVELGPGASVPGADPALPVIRLVYPGRLLLDQQRATTGVDSDTLAGTAPNGVSVLRWTVGHRWFSLAGMASRDSLAVLLQHIR
jgi:hypothetical protein